MRALVTGGNRYIGLHLLFELAKAGHDVTVANSHIAEMPQGCRRIHVDRTQPGALYDALSDHRDEFDVVTIHQVLHFLDEPEAAIAEAARMLAPGGRLAIIDLAPHALEHLRDEHAHIRLGFSHQTMSEWLERAGLSVEEIVDLKAAHPDADALTVTIWLARDQRAEAADPIAIRRRS